MGVTSETLATGVGWPESSRLRAASQENVLSSPREVRLRGDVVRGLGRSVPFTSFGTRLLAAREYLELDGQDGSFHG